MIDSSFLVNSCLL